MKNSLVSLLGNCTTALAHTTIIIITLLLYSLTLEQFLGYLAFSLFHRKIFHFFLFFYSAVFVCYSPKALRILLSCNNFAKK